ncbi:DUF6538 domain-containing protein [Erythrobacter sp. WG]|uniref:DUF6538 domain-containing protein n=1 Tax=Erythrobacter sp. WG TaxID=2985510 RepID=UPI003B63B5DA
MAAVRFPLPSPHSDHPETAENRHPDRESNPATAQSPATRSSPPQHPEKHRKTASGQAKSRVCSTGVSYNRDADSRITLSDRSKNRRADCHTRLPYNPPARGVWLRGAIYQFRVRVPADLRDALGCVHVDRSLRTDSRSLAVRLSRKVAAEVDAIFEAKRLEIGLAVEGIEGKSSFASLARPRLGSCNLVISR